MLETAGVRVLLVFLFVLVVALVYTKQKVKGRILCFFVRKDKSVVGKLCKLENDFIVWLERAYDVYPDFVRVTRYPMGWPPMFQELVPTLLFDEEDAIPLDWVNIDNRLERAMELKAALDENWLKKLVHEAAPEGGPLNLRKMLPIILIVVGVLGFLALMFFIKK